MSYFALFTFPIAARIAFALCGINACASHSECSIGCAHATYTIIAFTNVVTYTSRIVFSDTDIAIFAAFGGRCANIAFAVCIFVAIHT